MSTRREVGAFANIINLVVFALLTASVLTANRGTSDTLLALAPLVAMFGFIAIVIELLVGFDAA